MSGSDVRVNRRLVETYSRMENGWSVGSGQLLDNGLILTTAHTVPEIDVDRSGAGDGEAEIDVGVQVLTADGGRRWRCRVEWRRFENPLEPDGFDAAILRITDEDWREPVGLEPLRWGRLATRTVPVTVSGTGFPAGMKVLGDEGKLRYRDTQQFEGLLIRPARIRVHHLGPAVHGEAPPGERSLRWKGLSGAAVLAHGIILGITTHTSSEPDPSDLRLQQMTVLLADEQFRALVGAPLLEPVEFERLLASPVVPNIHSPASLLHPEARAVGFHGRDDVIARLDDWCDTPGQLSVRLVTGQGGHGKTRLAREFTDQMRAAGWTAGFVQEKADSADLDILRSRTYPVLLVVDYAEARIPQIVAALKAAEDFEPELPGSGPPRFRLLLLARDAGDWWNELRQALDGIHRLSADSVLPLPPLEGRTEDRPAAVRAAMVALALRLPSSITGEGPALTSATPWRLPDVSEPRYANALNLHTAALVAVLQQIQPVERSAEDSDEDVLLRHEQKFWRRTAAQYGLERLSLSHYRTAVAAATLCQADDASDAVRVLARLGVFGRDHDDLGPVARWLASLYPAPDQFWWGPLQPDRLGEFLVGRAVADRSDFFKRLLPDAPPAQALGALRIAARAESHQAHLAEPLRDVVADHAEALAVPALTAATQVENPQPLRTAVERVVDVLPQDSAEATQGQFAFLAELYQAIPLQTEALRTTALKLSGRLVDQARARADETSPYEVVNELAHRLNNHSLRLTNSGDDQSALSVAEESVKLRRAHSPGIADAADDQARERLGALHISLNTLSGAQAALNQAEAALATAEELLQLSEALAEHDPDAHVESLAVALTNYANHLGAVGRRVEAVAPAQRAVELYETLGEAEPERYLSDIALGYFNLALSLEDAGRSHDALVASEKSVAHYRQATLLAPDSYRADLADALTSCADHLWRFGDPERAIDAADEAILFFRSLVENRSPLHRVGLFNALNMVFLIARDSGRTRQAKEAEAEALDISRALYEEDPERHGAQYAAALLGHAIELSDLGRAQDALEASTQSLDLSRVLARTLPEQHSQGLARVLVHHANDLADVGLLAEAEAAAAEAVALCRRLAAEISDLPTVDLVTALETYASVLSARRKRRRALKRSAEAVDLARRLATRGSGFGRDELAWVLEERAKRLWTAGKRGQARSVMDEALGVRRAMFERNPEAHYAKLVECLNLAAGQDQELAVRHRAEVVTVLRALAGADRAAHGVGLATTLREQGRGLSYLGRRAPALEAAREAVSLFRELDGSPETLREFVFGLIIASTLWTELEPSAPEKHAAQVLAAADEVLVVARRLEESESALDDKRAVGTGHQLRALSLSWLGRHEEAVGAAEAGLEHCRELAEELAEDLGAELGEEQPADDDEDAAGAEITLADVLSRADRHSEALVHAQIAVAYYAPLLRRRDAVREVLDDGAAALNAEATALVALGRYGEAVGSSRRAARAARRLLKGDAYGVAIPHVAETLRTRATALEGVGHRRRARAVRKKADRLVARTRA